MITHIQRKPACLHIASVHIGRTSLYNIALKRGAVSLETHTLQAPLATRYRLPLLVAQNRQSTYY